MKFRIRFYTNNGLAPTDTSIYQFVTKHDVKEVYSSWDSSITSTKSKDTIPEIIIPLYHKDGDFDYECDSLEELMIAFPEYFL